MSNISYKTPFVYNHLEGAILKKRRFYRFGGGILQNRRLFGHNMILRISA